VLLGVLSHPLSMLTGYSGSGMPGGWTRFPGMDGCALAPVEGANLRVVLGYADSYPAATAMRERARAAGLHGVEANQDGCGRLRVYVDDVPTTEAARTLLGRARSAGMKPTVERDPDG